MLFVVNKPEFEHAIRIARDDRTKESQGRKGTFVRLEAVADYVEVEGLEAAARIPATVYEPGVLFLKITIFRRLLRTIRGEKFLTVQATADDLIVDKVRLHLESSDMLLYADPGRAPRVHPEQVPLPLPATPNPPATQKPKPVPKPAPKFRQRLLSGEFSDAERLS